MKGCKRLRGWYLAILLCEVGMSAFAQLPTIEDTARTGTTRSTLTPLYYGTGTDRLGGARMETLDSGVVLNLTGLDSTHHLWRVRLSSSLTGYVPVEQVAVDTLRPYPTGRINYGLLTSNWTVYGDSVKPVDYVAVRLPARLPYRSQPLTDPSRIIVDVFGATANTNWITQLRSTRSIKNVWFEQIADETFRIYIVLTHTRLWGYSIYYQRNTLMIRVRRPPTKRSLRGLTIAVDAGHGGSNTGASGAQSGQLEKNLTLDVATRLQQLLERHGARVLMTRTTDTLIGPSARILAMRREMPDVLVSIHFNSSGNRAVRGVSTYYKHVAFRPLSQSVLHELLKLSVPEFGNVGHFNFFFNAPTDYPNVLVEGPFLSNNTDESLILNNRFRQRMAKAIRRGLNKWIRSNGYEFG